MQIVREGITPMPAHLLAKFISGRELPLILGAFGIVFGLLFVWAGASRLWDARKAEGVKAIVDDVFWGAVGLGGGAALCVYCARLLLQYAVSEGT